MKDEIRSRAKHHKDHPLPTVIHHPEDDDTVLGRWLRIGMEKGTRFWLLLIGSVAAITLLLVILYGLSTGGSASDEAWLEEFTAKTPDDLLKAAETHPESPSANWARLRAAGLLYAEGVDQLTAQRDLAMPILNRAYEQFEQVFKQTKDPTQKRLAAFRMARTLEARGELDDAIRQYQVVAAGWPYTDEAAQSDRLIKALQTDDARTFYRQLAAFKPTRAVNPADAMKGFNSGMPPGHPPTNGPIIPASALPDLPGLPTGPAPSAGVPLNTIPEPAETATPGPLPTGTALPKDVFAPATKAAESPGSPPPSGELPRDVFAPGTKGEIPKP